MTMAQDIEKAKQRLLKRYEAKGIYENFGQDEVRKLRDKYGTDYTWQCKTAPIDAFGNWCMNFTG